MLENTEHKEINAKLQAALQQGKRRLKHESRVNRTLNAAGLVQGDIANSRPWEKTRATLALLDDLIGSGGPAGLGGLLGQPATDRTPDFSGLGAGRKHALDGGAWMAAASDALNRLSPSPN